MSVMIQIRNVPDALHRRLKSRAALAGMSLSDYPLAEIREAAERPADPAGTPGAPRKPLRRDAFDPARRGDPR